MALDKDVSPQLLLGAMLIGAGIGLLSGAFGKGGSALATPLLHAIGVPAIVAVASPLPATIPATLVARLRSSGRPGTPMLLRRRRRHNRAGSGHGRQTCEGTPSRRDVDTPILIRARTRASAWLRQSSNRGRSRSSPSTCPVASSAGTERPSSSTNGAHRKPSAGPST